MDYFFLDSNVEDGSNAPNHGICEGDTTCWKFSGEQGCMGALRDLWTGSLKMLEEYCIYLYSEH